MNSPWKLYATWLLKFLIVIDVGVLVLNFLYSRFGIELFFPAPGKRLNNPLVALLIFVSLLVLLDQKFSERWTDCLKKWTTQLPHRYYFFALLFSTIGFLEVMHFQFSYSIFWDLDKEQGYGTYFQTIQLFILGWVILIISVEEARDPASQSGRPWAWYAVAGLYFYLGLDDCLGIHENFIKILKPLAPESDLLHLVHEWLWVYAPFILAVVVFLARFILLKFRRDPGALMVLFTALGLWISVILLEGIARKLADPKGHFYSTLLEAGEEGAEMLGATLFLLGFSKYLRHLLNRSNDEDQNTP